MFGIQTVNRRWSVVALVLAALLVSALAVAAQGPKPHTPSTALGTGFTYQGQLKQNGAPVNGTRSLAFRLYDAPSGGSLLGSISQTLPITNGLFTTLLDYGSQFNGDERYLGIAIGPDPELAPRQRLSAVPYALYAIGNWGLKGNGGTTANNFLGTTDNMSLTLAVSGTAALRLLPVPGAPVIVGGYSGNSVGGTFDGATIAGGGSDYFGGNLIDGSNVSWSTIGGGVNNRIVGNAYNSTIAGGFQNLISATVGDAGRSTIGGGYDNRVTGQNATIAGGTGNTASGIGAFVGGGGNNGTTLSGNTATGNASTVGGGLGNVAGGDGATIAGGVSNTASLSAAIGGGLSNHAYASSFIGGGWSNTTSASFSTVGGGISNTASSYGGTVGGGWGNVASVSFNGLSTVSGGISNTASGDWSTVPGGFYNTASGNGSFAAGSNARARHTGAFVWADSSGSPISSTTSNQFLVRASGGITLFTNASATSGVMIAPGSSSWNVASDRNAKMNFSDVDTRAVLAALASIPVETWNYKTQDASIRHIGPMAQDFYAAFGVGENDTSISTVDAQGVALAAIQGLNKVVQEKDARIVQLEASNTAQQQQLADIQARLSALEGKSSSSSGVSNGLPAEWYAFGALLLVNLLLLTVVLVQRRRA